MNRRQAIAAAFFTSLVCTALNVAISQNISVPTSRLSSTGAPVQIFNPGFDDLMTILVQPRHIRLYYAGMQRNWELAAAEMRDLRAAFGRIAQSIQKYQGIDVTETLAAIMEPKMRAVDAAIAAADAKQFSKTYNELTAGCNGCHTYLEHPFYVIKVPDAAVRDVYQDQDFNMRR